MGEGVVNIADWNHQHDRKVIARLATKDAADVISDLALIMSGVNHFDQFVTDIMAVLIGLIIAFRGRDAAIAVLDELKIVVRETEESRPAAG